MPGFDGTGPEGKGAKTGLGEGNCGNTMTAKKQNISTGQETTEILGVGRGGRPRGGGRGHCYGGGRRRNGLHGRGGRNQRRADEVDE